MKALLIIFTCLISLSISASPIENLLERIDNGLSKKITTEIIPSDKDFFELDNNNNKVLIRGNNYVSIATGINWYLKYYAHIHLSWNGMTAKLPEQLPLVIKKERHETDIKFRYYLNYCTYSYSMAFWDWERWEKEIDWMALHGINLPLSLIGTDVVWYNVLERLGYKENDINSFIAGPAFQAWWLMNNLEGWGGPNPKSWYKRSLDLQRRILKRMKEFGMEPVFPGYSGMLPHNANEKLKLDIADPGKWNGYVRPAFLQPEDSMFKNIAEIYYKEQERLFGKANFYSMDPFHEGGKTTGVNLSRAGEAIWESMKKNNPNAIWVVQAWGNCPYNDMIKNIPTGDMLILDLYSESRPQWGDPSSSWYRESGFGHHNWAYCMLLNFGGNVGLHGKMEHIINAYFKAKESKFGDKMLGTGLTMEGIENNPVMFELFSELPWNSDIFSKEKWLHKYLEARYGYVTSEVEKSWNLLSNSIYNCPSSSTQQGTHESIFCARPSLDAFQVSSWSEMKDYYSSYDVINACLYMINSADKYLGNNNFEYDLVDIVRQGLSEKGRIIYKATMDAFKNKNKDDFKIYSTHFLNLILLQDKLLGARPEFKIGSWINSARNIGTTLEEKNLYEWNARVQVSIWGNRQAAENGGLRDYAHKEWSGILKDLYYTRWKIFFDELTDRLNGKKEKNIDFYTIDEKWSTSTNYYSYKKEGDLSSIIKEVYNELKQN